MKYQQHPLIRRPSLFTSSIILDPPDDTDKFVCQLEQELTTDEHNCYNHHRNAPLLIILPGSSGAKLTVYTDINSIRWSADHRCSTGAAFQQASNSDRDRDRQSAKKAPAKSCELDPIPTWLLKVLEPQIAPNICHLCNLSMDSGVAAVALVSSRHNLAGTCTATA